MSKVDATRPKKTKTGGRTKGTPNKSTALLKDAIIDAAVKAGNKDGLVGYLKKQASENPVAFMSLLGRVLPYQVNGAGENGEHLVRQIEIQIVEAGR